MIEAGPLFTAGMLCAVAVIARRYIPWPASRKWYTLPAAAVVGALACWLLWPAILGAVVGVLLCVWIGRDNATRVVVHSDYMASDDTGHAYEARH